MVKKHNRRLVAAICLLLAFKQTEVYGGFKNNHKKFMRFKGDLEKFIKHPPRSSLKYYELKVLSMLNFHLTVPLKVIMPHI